MKDKLSPETMIELIQAGEFFGISSDIPMREYHAANAYLGSSGLNVFRTKSAAHYKAYLTQQEDTPAMLLGRAIHSLVLEPDLENVVSEPEVNKRTKDGKAELEAFCEANKHRIILSPSEYQKAKRITDNLLTNSVVQALLKTGESEVSAFTKCPYTGVKVKARADRLLLEKRVILDLKSTTDASPSAFARSVANYGYAHSAAHYLDTFSYVLGEQMRGFVLVAFEKTAPFEIGVYEIGEEDLNFARAQNRQAMQNFLQCQETDFWPGYAPRVQRLSLPPWTFTDSEVA